jgi:integrase
VDPVTGRVTVAGKAPNGQAQPYFDRSRGVWVAPWRRPDGRVGRPTGKTRALAEASRDRHIAKAADSERSVELGEGFHSESTVGELIPWWLDRVARDRVRSTSLATYRKQLTVVSKGLGDVPVGSLRSEQVAAFISELADAGSASRARSIRMLLIQVLDQGVVLGLASDNVARKVPPLHVPRKQRRTLTPSEVARLLAHCSDRYVGAVALCYLQGWRVSEALGLAWQDIDLDQGLVRVRRASTYVDGVGMTLGPTKTDHTAGRQMLAPSVIQYLNRWQAQQCADRASLGEESWPRAAYGEEDLDLVFTTAHGKPLLRQHIDKAIRTAANKAGLDAKGLGTHAGRRSVITNLYASGELDLADVARFVGHTDIATTRGYVQHEGERPRMVSEKAFRFLDHAAPALDQDS